jgi:hypothetical protein
MDIATGYLEIGGLLTLDTHWQKLDKIRIILGNEVTKRTKDVIDAAVDTIAHCEPYHGSYISYGSADTDKNSRLPFGEREFQFRCLSGIRYLCPWA